MRHPRDWKHLFRGLVAELLSPAAVFSTCLRAEGPGIPRHNARPKLKDMATGKLCTSGCSPSKFCRHNALSACPRDWCHISQFGMHGIAVQITCCSCHHGFVVLARARHTAKQTFVTAHLKSDQLLLLPLHTAHCNTETNSSKGPTIQSPGGGGGLEYF